MLCGRVVMAGTLVLIGTGAAWATPITWYFSGELTYVADFGTLPNDVIVGTPFSGSFSYEPPIPDSLPAVATQSIYGAEAGALLLSVGSYDIVSGDTNRISVTSNGTLSAIDLYALDFQTPFGFAFDWSVGFAHIGEPLWPDTSLPLAVPSLDDFESRTMFADGQSFSISGVINTLTPEPMPLTLMLAVLSGLTLRRSRTEAGRHRSAR